jgi:hypothetical protein
MLADKSSLAWAGSGNTAPVDFVDPNNTCSAEDLRYEVIKIYAFAVRFVVRYRFIDGTTCDTDCFHLPEENTLITDQFPLHTATGIGNALCAVVGVVLFGSLATFVYIYRQQNPLQKVDVSVVLVTFFLSMLVSVSPIVFIGQPSDALCRLRNWVLFLPGFMMYSFMLARMYYMTTIMQEIKVSKRKATRQMFRMFLIWNTPLVLLLLVSTAYRPAKAIPKVIQATDAPTVVIDHFECTNVDSGLFYSTIAYLGMMALIGESACFLVCIAVIYCECRAVDHIQSSGGPDSCICIVGNVERKDMGGSRDGLQDIHHRVGTVSGGSGVVVSGAVGTRSVQNDSVQSFVDPDYALHYHHLVPEGISGAQR